MGCHAGTGGDSLESWDSETQLLARNELVMSFRLCRTARLDLASAWKSQRSVSHSTTPPMSFTAFVSARGTFQKTGRKPPRCGLSWVTKLAEVPPCSIVCDQLWALHTDYCLIGDLGDPCTAGQHKTPLLAPSDTCCFRECGGKHAIGSPSLSPRKPIHRMAKAARWISRDKHGGESPIRSCQVCTSAGSMALESSSRSCRIFQGNEPSGRPDTCENHVRELRTFFTVVLGPNIHTFSVLSETLQDFLKSKLC